VKAQKMAVVANARHPASPLAKQAAVLLISSAKTQKNSKCTRCRHYGGIFCRTKPSDSNAADNIKGNIYDSSV